MTVTIWHNPRCSKSRQALDLMRCRGVEPVIVDYLRNPPSEEELRRVIRLLGIPARDLVRKEESAYRERDLARQKDERALIEAMALEPSLIQRPVVISGDKAVIGRPPENVLELV